MAPEALAGTNANAAGVQLAQAIPAGPGEPIGRVENVGGTVTATRVDGTTVQLAPGDPVYQGDILESSADGGVGIVLVDETTFSMGPDGRMVLDEMIYDPASQEGSLAVSVLAGVFTFVSGHVAKSDPDAMVLETPVATIGIRGTQLGFRMVDGRMEVVNLPHPDGTLGEITVSNAAGVTTLNFQFQGVQVLSIDVAPGQPFTFSPQGVIDLLGPALAFLPPTAGANTFGVEPAGESASTQTPQDDGDTGDQAPAGDGQTTTDDGGVSPPPPPPDAPLPPTVAFGLPEIVPTVPITGLPPAVSAGPPPVTPPTSPPPPDEPEPPIEGGGAEPPVGGIDLGGTINIARSAFGIATTTEVDDDSLPRVRIEGEINNVNDIDTFSVQLLAGEILTMDIDFGQNLGDSVDTELTLLDSGRNFLANNDDVVSGFELETGGAGSVHHFDAFLQFTAPANGTYFVVVTSFNNDFPFTFGGSSAGDYVLQLSIAPSGGSGGFGTAPQTITDGESGIVEGGEGGEGLSFLAFAGEDDGAYFGQIHLFASQDGSAPEDDASPGFTVTSEGNDPSFGSDQLA